jgi:hypothetical protein
MCCCRAPAGTWSTISDLRDERLQHKDVNCGAQCAYAVAPRALVWQQPAGAVYIDRFRPAGLSRQMTEDCRDSYSHDYDP